MKVICNKGNVNLYEDNEILNINLNITNKKINLKQYCSFNFFDTLKDMNKTLIESCELIKDNSEHDKTYLLKLKSLNEDLGIPKQYIYFNTKIEESENNKIKFTSKSIDLPEVFHEEINDYDLLSFSLSELILQFKNDSVDIVYQFQFDDFYIYPQFIQRMISLTIKQLYMNLKIFIELI